MSTTIPESKCVQCGYVVEQASHIQGDRVAPEPDDLSICLKCAHVTKYGDDLGLVELTQEEVVEISLDSDFVACHKRVQWAISQVWAQHGGKAP